MPDPPQRTLADIPVGLRTRKQYSSHAAQRRLVSDEQYRPRARGPIDRCNDIYGSRIGAYRRRGHERYAERASGLLRACRGADQNFAVSAQAGLQPGGDAPRLLPAVLGQLPRRIRAARLGLGVSPENQIHRRAPPRSAAVALTPPDGGVSS